MLSLVRPDCLASLSNIISLLSKGGVALVQFRFGTEGEDCHVFQDFSPSTLEHLFTSFPTLEELCIDQEQCGSWPGSWVSQIQIGLITGAGFHSLFAGRLLCSIPTCALLVQSLDCIGTDLQDVWWQPRAWNNEGLRCYGPGSKQPCRSLPIAPPAHIFQS
jgi:hypothetical protein